MSPFIERLGWILIHSLWQFTLLAAVAFVFQRAMQRSWAKTRYAMLLGVLSTVVICPLATWFLLPASPESSPLVTRIESVPDSGHQPLSPLPEHPATVAPITASALPNNTPLPDVETSTVPVPSAHEAKESQSFRSSTWIEWANQSITPWLTTIVWSWSLGVLVFAIRPLWSWFTVRQLRTQGISPVSDSVQAALTTTARRLGITQAVRVLQSSIVQVPIVAGYLWPIILLPVSIISELPMSQLEAILAHELAHIRRHDYLVNLLQTLVETVFFYHPAV